MSDERSSNLVADLRVRSEGVDARLFQRAADEIERLTASLAGRAELTKVAEEQEAQAWREHAHMKAERDEWKDEWEGAGKTIRRQSDLLTAAVNLLRGDPPEDTLWSHHDIAELVKGIMAERDRLRAALVKARQAMYDCQHNAAKGKVCFDGDEWHETLVQVNSAIGERGAGSATPFPDGK